ncbi:flagellar basal-body rod protein FlgG [Microbaculum marinisediminis]|uniref:Flagellar basal-body rod protein FlgG n=1 Tax=Microbaculum marinisediminis TaxID=2931392 RepID=A0AAW5R294_9HYPH|nr:flagellar basal-body rod protein FlgG [Microbaculum sp. A6E488]MCT8972826.1 flagellar basal-body rod protein FlgG [Microbaculum sp. A6E488]
MKALHIAASGMMAQELNVEVISNNIANMRTTGFKRQRADFQDLLYENLRRPGASTSDTGTIVPTGIEIGGGVKTAATPRVMSQGNITMTEKELDVAIRGEGFFRVRLPDGRTAYSRDGSFERDSLGQLVTVDGYVIEPGITIPDDARGVSINSEGLIQAFVSTDTDPVDLGNIDLVRFVNPAGLEAMGDNLFLETPSSGPEQVGTPGLDGYGMLQQGYLEQANVNPVSEISDLIAAQRAYEMNSRVITAADEMMSSTASMR